MDYLPGLCVPGSATACKDEHACEFAEHPGSSPVLSMKVKTRNCLRC